MAKRVHENRLKLRWEMETSGKGDSRMDVELLAGSWPARNGQAFAALLRKYADMIDPLQEADRG